MAAAWECPTLPMIHLPLKESSKTNYQAIKPLIANVYGENPDFFNDEIKQLEQLRENSLKPVRDYQGCNMLRRYYAQLHLLVARFPEDSGRLQVQFTWKDAFSNSDYKQEGLQIELASILYNIGALHSQVGSKDGRHSEQDMKEALTHFQCAAGAFQYLYDHHASNGCNDISPQLIEMFKCLMLAQAQECTVEKSLKGLSRVKNLNISKIAMKVAQYYQSVLNVLETAVGASIVKKHKEWLKQLQIKSTLYTAIAHLYQANALEEQGNYGYMIAFQQLSLQKIQSIGKLPRGTPDVFKDAVKNFTEYISLKLETSHNQNEQVFHELVPGLETLEPAPGVELVKPIVFQPMDRKTAGTDIFSRLVPMSAYEAASVYSEEKAKILRSIASSVEEKDEELERFISSLNMDEIDHAKAEDPTLPAELLAQHQLLQSKIQDIRSIDAKVQELKTLSENVQQKIDNIAKKKLEEEQQEKEYQERHGFRPESQVCSNMWKELHSLAKYHRQASNSNTELFNAFEKHRPNLLLLAGHKDTLLSGIPRMSLNNVGKDFSEERWKELMDKIDEMKAQRISLIQQLRDQIDQDDITRVIIGELSTDRDTLFDEYLQKHRSIADIIRQNLSAQDNILRALTEANAQQAQLRQAYHQMMKRREEWCIGLAKSAGHYDFLESKISEGLDFYSKLAESVFRLYKRCQEVCATRHRERQSVEKMAVNSKEKTSSPSPPPPNTGPHEDPLPALPRDEPQPTEDEDDSNEVQKMIFKMKQMQDEQKASLDSTPSATADTPDNTQSNPNTMLMNSVDEGKEEESSLLQPIQPPLVSSLKDHSPSETDSTSQNPTPSSQPPLIDSPVPFQDNQVLKPNHEVPVSLNDQLPTASDSSLTDKDSMLVDNIAAQTGQILNPSQEVQIFGMDTDSDTLSNPISGALSTPTSGALSNPISGTLSTPISGTLSTSISGTLSTPISGTLSTPISGSPSTSTSGGYTPFIPSSIPPLRPEKPQHLIGTPVASAGEEMNAASVLPLLNDLSKFSVEPHSSLSATSNDLENDKTTMPSTTQEIVANNFPLLDNGGTLNSLSTSSDISPDTSTKNTDSTTQPMIIATTGSTIEPNSTVPILPTAQMQFLPPPPLSVTTKSDYGEAHSNSSTSTSVQLENMVVSQQKMIQNQSEQLNKQQEQLKTQTAIIEELRNELQLLRTRQAEQDKEKTASSTNQAMLMKLLQQQQGLFTQQQTHLDKINKEGEARRQQTTELEMKLRDALAQEQFQNQSLQAQIAQQSKEVQHTHQQLHTASQQLQALQVQAQQYLVQIQERDKALTNYREEHRRIVEGMEAQFKQRMQQLTQQMQDLQVRNNVVTPPIRGQPHGLQQPLQPQPHPQGSPVPYQYQRGNSQPGTGSGLDARIPAGQKKDSGVDPFNPSGLLDSSNPPTNDPNASHKATSSMLQPTVVTSVAARSTGHIPNPAEQSTSAGLTTGLHPGQNFSKGQNVGQNPPSGYGITQLSGKIPPSEQTRQIPSSGQAPLPGQIPSSGQIPLSGQISSSGQMPLSGQIPPPGQTTLPGQIPPSGQATHFGQVPPSGQAQHSGQIPPSRQTGQNIQALTPRQNSQMGHNSPYAPGQLFQQGESNQVFQKKFHSDAEVIHSSAKQPHVMPPQTTGPGSIPAFSSGTHVPRAESSPANTPTKPPTGISSSGPGESGPFPTLASVGVPTHMPPITGPMATKPNPAPMSQASPRSYPGIGGPHGTEFRTTVSGNSTYSQSPTLWQTSQPQPQMYNNSQPQPTDQRYMSQPQPPMMQQANVPPHGNLPKNQHGSLPQHQQHRNLPQHQQHGNLPQNQQHGNLSQYQQHGNLPQHQQHGNLPQNVPHFIPPQNLNTNRNR